MSKKTRPFTKLINDFIRLNDLDGNSFKLYAYLKSYNPCYPSYKTINRDTGLSNATIRRCICELQAAKLLKYEKGNSFKKSNRYILGDSYEIRYVDCIKNEIDEKLKDSNNCNDSDTDIKEEPLQNLEAKKNKSKKNKKEEQVGQSASPSRDFPQEETLEDALELSKIFQRCYFETNDKRYIISKDSKEIRLLQEKLNEGILKEDISKALKNAFYHPRLSKHANSISFLIRNDDVFNQLLNFKQSNEVSGFDELCIKENRIVIDKAIAQDMSKKCLRYKNLSDKVDNNTSTLCETLYVAFYEFYRTKVDKGLGTIFYETYERLKEHKKQNSCYPWNGSNSWQKHIPKLFPSTDKARKVRDSYYE